MSDALDQVSITWEEDGEIKVKEIARHVLSKGAWATVMFLYQELDPKTKEFREPKVSIRRYKKRGDQYLMQSRFNISSAKQGHEIAKMIHEWFPAEAEG